MNITVEFWQVVGLVVTIIGAFFTLAKMLLQGSQRSIDEKFKLMGDHMRSQDESSRRLERDLMDLKAELPRDYVRREDYTQAIATITTKIDAMVLRIERSLSELVRSKGARDE